MRKILLLSLLFLVFGFRSFVSFAAVVSEPIDYIENGQDLQGMLYYDNEVKSKQPGIIVVHEWKGLGDYAKKRAEMLAGLGYVAFAVDMYGKGIFAKDHEEAGQLAGVFFGDRMRMRDRAMAAYYAFIQTNKVDPEKVAAIGYCFGGTTVLEMARSGLSLRGVASFHGVLATPTPAEKGRISAKVLVLTGEADKMVLPADVETFKKEMDTAGANAQVVGFPGAMHSFTVWDANMPDKGIMYNKEADEKSWELLKNFLAEIFKNKGQGTKDKV